MRPDSLPPNPATSRDEIASHCVVGSGPAAVACAKALLARGARVFMLDAGITLESSRLGLIEKFKAAKPESWSPEDLAAYQAGMNPDVGGVPLKLVYGSDFAYRDASEHLRARFDNVGLRPSFARGGLSNVWGAAMMPYAAKDLDEWPFGVEALAPHYAAVLDFTGLAARADALEEFFPLHTKNLTLLEPSAQSRHLLERMELHRSALAAAGIRFGRSRLAVRGNHPPAQDGCVYCRLCMYGCPYGFIYSSADTLTELQRHPNFTYEAGVVVTSVREQPDAVEVSGYDLAARAPRVWRANRVFLGAGTISTTQILLRSLAAYEQTVWFKDSQYFLLPLLLTRRIRGARTERSFGLSQIFVEMFDPLGENKSVHVQLYSNSDLINAAVANVFGPLRQALAFLVRNLQERLVVAQGFLHSQYSSRIGVRLTRSEQLELRGEVNPAAAGHVRAVARKLLRHTRHLGAVPLTPMLKIADPGRSFHSGGSFPMRAAPRGFETDLLGRPPGWQRVHAVDATVFPSIPATTITLSAMANAHRIGCEAARLDRPAAAN